jgi:putative FmdB family regulatory protein
MSNYSKVGTMPLYVYKCKNCEHQFEARQRFSDDPLTECPECHGQVRRVINSVGVVFKGSGFYVTDSRNGKKSSLINGSASSSSEEKAENTGKAEKSEKKAEESSPAAAVTSKTETKTPAKSSEAPA